MKKRNGEIDLLRFVFSICILCYHYGASFGKSYIKYGNAGVEFFFIVSGYLMAAEVSRKGLETPEPRQIADETWHFIGKKIGAFYKYYLSAIILQLVLRFYIIQGRTIKDIIRIVISGIPILSLTFMGFNYNNSGSMQIGNSWYLSAMIIAMFILYPLLRKSFHYSAKLIFPLITLFTIGYIYSNYGVLSKNETWNGFVYLGLVRAVGEISFGVTTYVIADALKDSLGWLLYSKSHTVKFFLSILKWGVYAVIFAYIKGINVGKNFSLHEMLFTGIAVMLSFLGCGYTIPDSAVTRYLGKLSLPIYIFHGVFRWSIHDAIDSKTLSTSQFVTAVVGTIIACFAMYYLTNAIAFVLKKGWNRLKKSESVKEEA